MNFCEMRKAARLTQEDVAKKLDVTQSAVSKWERGASRPLKKYQKKLAKLFGCTIEELMQTES